MSRRYFIGLKVPQSVQDHLAAFVESIKSSLPTDHPYKVSWTHRIDLHCTLLFIGQCEDEQHLMARLTDVAQQLRPVELTLSGPTHWLGRNSLALKVSGADHLGTTVVHNLRDLSSDRWAGRRPFHGHITIGRIRPVPNADADIFGGRAIEPITWNADHIHVMRSRDSNSDHKYETVADVPLSVSV